MHMLRRWEEISGFGVHTQEGAIGRIESCRFDGDTWTVRYLSVPAEGVVPAGQFLISPIAVVRFDDDGRFLTVKVSHNQLRHAPCPDLNDAKSPDGEAGFYRHFGWPVYWRGGERWGRTPYPNDINIPPEETGEPAPETVRYPARFHAPADYLGRTVAALDGAAGRIENLLIDDESWAVRYLVIDARKWIPGRRIVVSPHWLIDGGGKDVAVELLRGEIKNAPPYDPNSFVTREYEQRLFKHYGRERDWQAVTVGRRPQQYSAGPTAA